MKLRILVEMEKVFEPDCTGCQYLRRVLTATDRGDMETHECRCCDIEEECPEVIRESFPELRQLDYWNIESVEVEEC